MLKCPEIIFVAENIRSVFNVGSILRGMDCFGFAHLVVTGITPYPKLENDVRLPHVSSKLDREISKVALGAERTVVVNHVDKAVEYLLEMSGKGFKVFALEQGNGSISPRVFAADLADMDKIIFVLGAEVEGVSAEVLGICDGIVEIRQFGAKESLNVSVAASILMYELSLV
jgi:23S rRNA (guanosine2251-2'-O)-methyltransferase